MSGPTGMGGTDQTSNDDRLFALLDYVFSPIVPLIVLLMEDKKKRPFIRAHNAQALVLGIVNVIVSIGIGWTLIGLCLPIFIWFAMVYWGFKAYQGEYVVVPVITDFVKKQGWA